MPTRRDFIKLGSTGVAGLVAAQSLTPAAKAGAAAAPRYPVVPVAPLKDIGAGATLAFAYPDAGSPAVLLRLSEPAARGVGPGRDIVAYSTLCTHKGCPVSFKPERKMLICPCHWSTFDPAKAGALIIGQASEQLPQIELRVTNGVVEAIGVSGLIYGRHTNVV
ncbi:MAG TPA: arsenate reductase (azurin) small subunit [Methylomirabilota bacterium]|jgi:arsenite oxidase small subunit|nr:arsenate reductase (azurin) small subunit [Methylomirabilota bacterium]